MWHLVDGEKHSTTQKRRETLDNTKKNVPTTNLIMARRRKNDV